MTIFLWCVGSPWWWLLVCKSKHPALKPHDSISRSAVESRPRSSQLNKCHHSWMSRLQVICLLLPRRETSLNFQNYRFGPRRSEYLSIPGLLAPYNSSSNHKIQRNRVLLNTLPSNKTKKKQSIIPQYTRTRCCIVITGRLPFKCDGTRAETRFRLSAKRTSPFKPAGSSVQSTTGSRGVCISGSNAGYTTFRGSVKSTGYPLHSPVSPPLPLPCVTVCHHMSTGLYIPTIRFHWSCWSQTKWDRVKHADDMEVLPHVFVILVKRT
jgi:hypothetical protein